MKFSRNFNNSSVVFYLFSAFIVVAIAWAALFKIDTSVQITGSLSPQGRPIKIQNRFSGKVVDLPVAVGQLIKKDEVLIQMETTIDESEMIETQIDLDILLVQRQRLLAQLKKDPALFEEFGNKIQYFVDQSRILRSELATYREQQILVQEELRSLQSELENTQIALLTFNEALELAEAKNRLVAELFESGYEGELSLLEAKQKVSEAKQNIIGHQTKLQSLSGKIESSKASLRAKQAEFDRKTSNELSDVERRIELGTARKKSLEARVGEFTILAPESGLISKRAINNAGEIVEPGQLLFEIIPEGIANVFYGRLAISDALDVFPGQPARVTLVTMDTRSEKPLDAIVQALDPDVTTDDDGSKYYGITLKFNEAYEETALPGVTGTAFLLTGKRTVLEYLAEPIFDTLRRSLSD